MVFSKRKIFYSAVLLLCVIFFMGSCAITEFFIDTQVDRTQSYGHIKEKIQAVIEKDSEQEQSAEGGLHSEDESGAAMP